MPTRPETIRTPNRRDRHKHATRAVTCVRIENFAVTRVFHSINLVSADKLNYYAVKMFRTRTDYYKFGVDRYAARTVKIVGYCRFKLGIARGGHALKKVFATV